MTLSFDLYWSVRSPYSYLATPRLYRLQRDFNIQCRVRPVLPHALRDPRAVGRRDELWLSYFKRDIVRTAEFLGMPMKWPTPDPVVTDPSSGAALPEQPHVHRLTRMIVAAEARLRGVSFIYELSCALWSPDVDDWTAPGVLLGVCRRAGLDLIDLEMDATTNAETYDAVIARNDAAEQASGHWGVPVMVFEGEPFFGQDRIDQLIWRLESRGLRQRMAPLSLESPEHSEEPWRRGRQSAGS